MKAKNEREAFEGLGHIKRLLGYSKFNEQTNRYELVRHEGFAIRDTCELNTAWETWQAAQDPVLDKPACVGGGTFQPGVKWSTVIGAAQRQYEYKTKDPVKPIISPADMLRVATGELVLVDVSKHIIIPKGTASGALND